jgi:hypothetical protein
VLFESYATANDKYEKVVEQSHVNWDDHSEPDIDLMDPLCTTINDNTQAVKETPVGKRAEVAKRVRGIVKSVAQTAKNLRSIAVEPKLFFGRLWTKILLSR